MVFFTRNDLNPFVYLLLRQPQCKVSMIGTSMPQSYLDRKLTKDNCANTLLCGCEWIASNPFYQCSRPWQDAQAVMWWYHCEMIDCIKRNDLNPFVYILLRQQDAYPPYEVWTHWGLSPGPPACWAGVIPLHHVPCCKRSKVACSCFERSDSLTEKTCCLNRMQTSTMKAANHKLFHRLWFKRVVSSLSTTKQTKRRKCYIQQARVKLQWTTFT